MTETSVKKTRTASIIVLAVLAVGIILILYARTNNVLFSVSATAASITGVIGFAILAVAHSTETSMKRCSTPVLAKLSTKDPTNIMLTYKYKNKTYKCPASNIRQPSAAQMQTIMKKGMMIHINPDKPQEIRMTDNKDVKKLRKISYMLLIACIVTTGLSIGLYLYSR